MKQAKNRPGSGTANSARASVNKVKRPSGRFNKRRQFGQSGRKVGKKNHASSSHENISGTIDAVSLKQEPTLNGKKSQEFKNKRKLGNNDDSGGHKKKLKVGNTVTVKNTEDDGQPRLQKKDLRLLRRKKKQNYELTVSVIKKYDGLRRKDTSAEKKKIMIDEVLDIIAGHAHEVVFKHDTVRVIQMCIKHGNTKQRAELFEQFKDNIAELALKKYSKFFVKKMMKYGSKEQRCHIINSFNRKVKKYIRHKEAGDIIETIYNDYANAPQRKFLLQEFYGAEYSVFKCDDARSLEEIVAENPHKKPYILRNLKETLLSLIEKSLLSHTIVHKALLEFFNYADEKMRGEMIEAIRESLAMILHTSDGARVTMLSLWHGTPKDRKVIVKSFKTYVKKICQEEYGHLTLLALFDCVDDTVLIQKTIVAELISSLSEIVENHYGRKVILYLVAPRSPAYFAPQIIQLLAQGDGNKHSKKETAVRRKELLSGMSSSLIDFATENVKTLLFDKALSQLFVAIVHNVEGDVECAFQNVVKLVTRELDLNSDEEEDHVVKSASGHFVIKQLIQLDKKRVEKGSDVLFAPLLMERSDPELLYKLCQINRGAFVVVSLLESSLSDVREDVKKSLKPYLSKLEKITNKGVEIVMKLLKKE